MNRIRVPIEAYILGLLPQSMGRAQGGTRSRQTGQQLQALASGLALPSFWTRSEINQTFAEANRIWIREAEIEFSPITISERSEAVPADENGMWAHFINNLTKAMGPLFLIDIFVGYISNDKDPKNQVRYTQQLSKTVVIKLPN